VVIGGLELTVATTARGPMSGRATGRLEAEMLRLAAGPRRRATLVRIAVAPDAAPRVLGAMTEALAGAELVEERGDGEYAALLHGEPDAVSAALDRLRAADPSARVTSARYPEDGLDAGALWAKARAADGEETLDIGAGAVVADAVMLEVYRVARRLALAESTVLILGETGAGKEVIAEFIHRAGPRAKGPFVRLNCASLPETLLESELFGHERGAFTGAERRKIGYLEAAHGGTLLLDEIGELPLGVQAKLLRALETRRAPRVGGTQEVAFDVRFLCATHRDLAADVAAGSFRQDLYFRVRALSLKVPPLRNRPAEIALLAQVFLRSFADKMGRPAPSLLSDAMAALLAHPWPGNVRELKHAMEHAVVMGDRAAIGVAELPEDIARPSPLSDVKSDGVRGELADIERRRIIEALERTGGNHTRAAKALGISRRNLLYKLTKYGLRD
jgi:transcriptional regulator with PAS, ATPase and Fis domain